jgi:hypothetical protein
LKLNEFSIKQTGGAGQWPKNENEEQRRRAKEQSESPKSKQQQQGTRDVGGWVL